MTLNPGIRKCRDLYCYLELPRPRQAHIQYRLPRSLIPWGLRLGQYAFGFLLAAEYIFHIHTGFFHHVGFEVRIDIGRDLVVRVAQYFQGDQRLNTYFE